MLIMIKNFDKPLACWKSKERHKDEIIDSLTVIFKTRGCGWNRCRMCGYRHERYPGGLAPEELSDRLQQQLSSVLQQFPQEEYQMVKIFTSGSFFDPCEVPDQARNAIAEAFFGKVIIAETRPEYIHEDLISDFLNRIDDGSRKDPLYAAVGLETTNDLIREKCIDKGFTYEEFLHAVDEAHAGGAGVKSYLLLKPLFLTEREAIDDMHASVAEAAKQTELISLNASTVQRRTEMEWYWKRGAFRPPYLWSLVSVLLSANVHLLCDPIGGGHARGPHNCRRCDHEILSGIREYSLHGDRGILTALMAMDCDCKREWECVLEQETPFAMPLTR
jgi:archaeosine synthase beta-subunit